MNILHIKKNVSDIILNNSRNYSKKCKEHEPFYKMIEQREEGGKRFKSIFGLYF